MYFAHFHSYIRYGIIFWGNNGESKKIFKLQKRVIRIISNVSRTTSCRELFKRRNIRTVPCIYIMEILCYIKVNIGKYEKNSVIHDRNTCQRKDFHIQDWRTEVCKNIVKNLGKRLYNKLPNRIKCVEDIQHFRRKLKLFLLQQSFYTVEEYCLCKSW
jgi:hypothetical protein